MPAAQLSLVDRSVRTAARRLVGQSLLDNLSLWLAVSTGLALAWFVVQPLLFGDPPVWLRWTVLAGLTAVGLGMAVWQTVRAAPSRRTVALEVDNRFNLRERVTTALELSPAVQRTPAGEAVAADAVAKVKKLEMGEKFPVKPRWTVALAPAFALLIAAVVLWWNPAPLSFARSETAKDGKGGEKGSGDGKGGEQAKKPQTPEEKKLDEQAKRKSNDPQLAELEGEIKDLNKKFDKDPYDDLPGKVQERVAETTKLEEKADKIAKEKEREVQELKNRLDQLGKLGEDKDFQGEHDKDAKELAEALAKGDLGKAEEELEGLKKKLEDEQNKLSPEELKRLQDQLDKMEDELERLEREQEKKKEELEKEKEKAKEENRPEDEEKLDRELERLKEEQKQEQKDGAEAKELGDQLQKASDALKGGDQKGAAEALQKAKQSVQKMEEKDGDSQKAQAQARQLKRQRSEAAAAAQAAGGQKKGDELTKSKSGPNNGGTGAGERDLGKEVETDKEETRVRSIMDMKGETKYGGLTEGKGFKKATDKELGGQIKKAAQDAPGAADVQRLPRDAKEGVADYFKNLGGTDKK